jgi:hypothetical protein
MFSTNATTNNLQTTNITSSALFVNGSAVMNNIIYMGNQINTESDKINTEPAFCLHAYIVTLLGARKLLNCIIRWDYYDQGFTGLVIVDIILIDIQKRVKEKKLRSLFTWYCWNGTYHPCEHNMLPLEDRKVRNSGLVFQDDTFESTVTF